MTATVALPLAAPCSHRALHPPFNKSAPPTRLHRCSQNFKGTGLLGRDVVAELRRELAALGVDALVPAVMNDTVATLVSFSGSWSDLSAVACSAGCSTLVPTLPAGALCHNEVLPEPFLWLQPATPRADNHVCLPCSPDHQVALRYSEPDTQLGIIVGTGGWAAGGPAMAFRWTLVESSMALACCWAPAVLPFHPPCSHRHQLRVRGAAGRHPQAAARLPRPHRPHGGQQVGWLDPMPGPA